MVGFSIDISLRSGYKHVESLQKCQFHVKL
jgi:hypothetical protein